MAARQSHTEPHDPTYAVPQHVATDAEWLAMIDQLAHKYLGMSGDAFARAWEAGEIEDPDRSEVLAVAMMLPNFERRAD